MHCNLYIQIQVVLIWLLGFSSAENRFPRNENTLPLQIDLRRNENCGGLVQSTFATISYKSQAFVDPNERCTWIVRAPNSTAYNITINSLGPPSSLIISAITDYLNVEHVVPTTSDVIFLNRTLVFVVTFATGSINLTNKTRGFSLTYNRINEGGNRVSNFSADAILSADFGHFKHDIRTNFTSDYELSIFVITPVKGFGGTFKKMEITIIPRRFFVDMYSVYMFNENAIGSNKWANAGTSYGIEYDKISTSDMILLVLYSLQGPPVSEGPRRLHLVSNTLTC